MTFDAMVALVVLGILFGILFGVIWWARGAPAYDDGRGSAFVTYVEEPEQPDDGRRAEADPKRGGATERKARPSRDDGPLAANGPRDVDDPFEGR